VLSHTHLPPTSAKCIFKCTTSLTGHKHGSAGFPQCKKKNCQGQLQTPHSISVRSLLAIRKQTAFKSICLRSFIVLSLGHFFTQACRQTHEYQFIFLHERNLISPRGGSSIHCSCVVKSNIHYRLVLLKAPHYCTLHGRDYKLFLCRWSSASLTPENTAHCYSYVYITEAWSLLYKGQ